MESVYSVEPAPDGASPTSLDVLSFLDALVNSTEEQCFSARSRSTVLEGLPFGGVPTVLAINFILWLVSRPGGCHVHRHRGAQLGCQRLAVSTSVCVTGVLTATGVRRGCQCARLFREMGVSAGDQKLCLHYGGQQVALGQSGEITGQEQFGLRQEFFMSLGS